MRLRITEKLMEIPNVSAVAFTIVGVILDIVKLERRTRSEKTRTV